MAKTVAGLPTDLVGLQTRLAMLKDREARLEADLAIRESPELEAKIIRLVILMTDVKKAEKEITVSDKPPSGNLKELEALGNQLKFYQGKVDTLKARIEELSGDAGSKFSTLKTKKALALSKLQEEWDMMKADVEKEGVNLLTLLPTLADLLKV